MILKEVRRVKETPKNTIGRYFAMSEAEAVVTYDDVKIGLDTLNSTFRSQLEIVLIETTIQTYVFLLLVHESAFRKAK